MEKTLRVMYVHHGQGIGGGAPVSLVNLILGIKQIAKIDMIILCLDDEMLDFFNKKTGVPVALLPNPLKNIGKVLIWGISPLAWETWIVILKQIFYLPNSIFRQWLLFRKLYPDIVHLNSSVLFTSAIAARLAGLPVIWHVREVVAGNRFSIRRFFVGWLIRNLANRVIAISPVEAQRLGSDHHKKIVVVYNSIDLKRFAMETFVREKTRRELGFLSTDKIIISLGGVSHWKGTVELIESMSFTDNDTHLIFIGPPFTGNYLNIRSRIRLLLRMENILVKFGFQDHRLINYTERVGLALAQAPNNRIHFLGITDNVVPFLSASDILVFAGTGSHFPRPVFEAWAMKKPVIVFDVLGIREHVENGVDSIVVKEKTGQELGYAITSLLNDHSKMTLLGENGYSKAKNLFDQVGNAEQIFSIYQQVGLASPV